MKRSVGNVFELSHRRTVVVDRSGIAKADLNVRVAFGEVLAVYTNEGRSDWKWELPSSEGALHPAAGRIGKAGLLVYKRQSRSHANKWRPKIKQPSL